MEELGKTPESVVTFLKESGRRFEQVERCLRDAETGLCPLCQACLLVTGEFFQNEDAHLAGKTFGATDDVISAIIKAADGWTVGKDLRERMIKELCG